MAMDGLQEWRNEKKEASEELMDKQTQTIGIAAAWTINMQHHSI